MDISDLYTGLRAVADLFSTAELRVSPVYLLATLPIVYAIYRLRRPEGGFLSWLMPRSIYMHPSHMLDIKLFFAGRLIAALGILNVTFVATATAAWIGARLGDGEMSGGFLPPALIALLILLVNDFSIYWIHRLHHEWDAIWPFHAVHHSAEVLTPLTVYRKHPVYDLLSAVVRGAAFGALQGVLLGLFVGKIEVALIAGVNAGYFLFNALGANLRHSHLWLGYGPVLSRILISPAQHQIHHSRAARHHNKNYGEILAIWDWMFGTLYVPQAEEQLRFGISEGLDTEAAQPHPTLTSALILPVRQSWCIALTALTDRARLPDDGRESG